ncbi:MAG: hypothetical protein ACFB11_02585 [Paracoccaceae bacterium]
MKLNVFAVAGALVLFASASSALERATPPDFFPDGEYVRSSDCKEPFTGWLNPTDAHLVVVTDVTSFHGYPTANEDLQRCVGMLAHFMVLGGQAHVPVRYELMDDTGRVLQSKTLDLLNS